MLGLLPLACALLLPPASLMSLTLLLAPLRYRLETVARSYALLLLLEPHVDVVPSGESMAESVMMLGLCEIGRDPLLSGTYEDRVDASAIGDDTSLGGGGGGIWLPREPRVGVAAPLRFPSSS